VRKQYIELPLPMTCSFFYKLWARLKGILLSPIYLVKAHIAGGPGIGFHLRCVATGARLLLTRSAPLKTCYNYLCFPMDSTRYFEFHEVWESVNNFVFKRYLDVSSPRLIPLFILKTAPGSTAVLINPDNRDIKETEQLADALGLKSRCEFFNCTIEDARLSPGSFELITCISVLEHILQDKTAVESMWALLTPGGKLLLTLPCMSHPLEQYISHNPYGLLSPGDDGYTFWQRYYDLKRLESCIYSITGAPLQMVIYGEKTRGLFFKNATMKRLLGHYYPFWREPFMMATEYQIFSSTGELPGEGVVILEFIKPAGSTDK
jgi:SAM-dependent methyltransferase